MKPYRLPADLVERVTSRIGRRHPFGNLVPAKTAFLVIDMQNYFVKPGFVGAVKNAIEIVPAINRLADFVRRAGGHVVWIKNSTKDTRVSWSVYHEDLLSPEIQSARYETLCEGHEGHELWAPLQTAPEDAHVVKKRFSAFIQGSSDIEQHLRGRGIDTILIGGTTTDVCCESSARDAMMLNFKAIMVSDALAAARESEHENALAAFYSLFGDVLTVDEVIGFMGGEKSQAAKSELLTA